MRVAKLLLTGGGLGHMRPASGTWGSLPPPLIVLLVVWLAGPGWWIDAGLVAGILLFSWACVAFGRRGEEWFGRKDPSQVVADEIAGQCVALLALPWAGLGDTQAFAHDAATAATAFLTFRMADIIKPPPADGLQRLPHGWGILVDDLVAGVYALIVTQAIARLVL